MRSFLKKILFKRWYKSLGGLGVVKIPRYFKIGVCVSTKALILTKRNVLKGLNSMAYVKSKYLGVVLCDGILQGTIFEKEQQEDIFRKILQNKIQEKKIDLILYLTPDEEGRCVQIYFVIPLATRNTEIYGLSSKGIFLNLPLEFDETWSVLLQMGVYGSIIPNGDYLKSILVQELPKLLSYVRDFVMADFPGMEPLEIASIQGAVLHSAMYLEDFLPNKGWASWARGLYGSVLDRIPLENGYQRYAFYLVWIACLENEGRVLKNREILLRAANCLKALLNECESEKETLFVARLWIRLGKIYYTVDEVSGDSMALKKAIDLFQNALQIFDEEHYPLIWGDLMYYLCLSLQVYGCEVFNKDVLKHAVYCGEKALLKISSVKSSVMFCSLKNALGTSLMILSKHENFRSYEYLKKAANCFEEAAVTLKNIGHHRESEVAFSNWRSTQKQLSGIATNVETVMDNLQNNIKK